MGENFRILCIIPAWNEARTIGDVVRRVPRDLVDSIVVIDDGSCDKTGDIAKLEGAIVIRNGKNYGVGASIRSGISYGIANDYQIAVVVSGAGKTPPELIPRLVAPIIKGEAAFVQGSRYIEGGRGVRLPLHRKVGTWLYSILFSICVGTRVTDASSGFRAFRLSILKDAAMNIWQEWLNRYELEPYLLFKAIKSGIRVKEVGVVIEYPPIGSGTGFTKMRPFIDWWKIIRPVLFLWMGIKR